MDHNQSKRAVGQLSAQSQHFIQKMVERFFLLSPSEQVEQLKQIDKRLEYFNSLKKNIDASKSTQRTSSLSNSDQSPTHFKKTTSLLADERVAEFITSPEIKSKAHSQQIIQEPEKKNKSNSLIGNLSFVSQQCELSTQQVNQFDLYPIPQKLTKTQEQHAFYKKIIRPLKFLGIPGSQQKYKKALESRKKIKQYPNNFKEVPNLGLFYMDLVTKIGRAQKIRSTYLGKLQALNKILMFKIQIGMNFKRQDLQKIFGIHWQSLVEIILQRIWSQQSEKEHGLDFFTCKQNLKKIKKIMLLGNYLTKKFCESLKHIKLPQLQVLEMNFQQQVDHEELLRIFEVISTYNNKFQIHLVTGTKDKNELPAFLTQKYGERIYLYDRNQKPSEKLQKQRPVEEIKYEKPAYQKAHEEKQKIGPKPEYIPRKTVASNINPNLPFQKVSLRQQTPQAQQQQVQGSNNIPAQQYPGLVNPPPQPTSNQPLFSQQQLFNGIGINVSQNSKIEGPIKIGTSQINQKTSYHHQTNIVHQTTQRIVEKHYETDYESRSRRNYSNYDGNRSQYGGQRGDYYDDDSSDDEPQWRNGYSYQGRNNQQYKKRYNGNNYYGYYKNWYD